MVLRGIGRLDMGLATVGGLGIVLLAITLDRLTQAMGKSRRSAGRRWWHTGPVGFVLRQLQRLVSPTSSEGAQAAPALSTQAH
jgi:glycine betaine/proline transport system permease protein